MFKLPKKDKGITLPELLIAACVLSIGIIVLIYSLNRFSKSTVFCENIKNARHLAQDLIEEIKTKKFDEREFSWPLGAEGEKLPRINFDDVDDYHGLIDFPITDSSGRKIKGFAPFKRVVNVCYVDGNFREVLPGITTPFKKIEVKVKWKQDIGEEEEKCVTLLCIKAKDTVTSVSGWEYVLFSDDDLKVTKAKIRGNIHSNKNAYLKDCKVYGNITACKKIKPKRTIPGKGDRIENASPVCMPTVVFPNILKPEEPNLKLCQLKEVNFKNLPYEINLEYYKNLAKNSGFYYDGDITYKTDKTGKKKTEVLKKGGYLDYVIYATGDIIIGSDWWKDKKTKLRIRKDGALIAEGMIKRWNNSYEITSPYPPVKSSRGKCHVGILGVKGIKLDKSAYLVGTFFSKGDIDFSPYGKGRIFLKGDIRTLGCIRTDKGGKVYGGENIKIVESKLHAGKAALLHRVGYIKKTEVRADGKIRTRASWRDNYVEAGIFLCSGGTVKADLYAKEDIVFVAGGKNKFWFFGTVRTDKNILSYNTHLGRGFISNCKDSKFHAKGAIWINNLTYRLKGEVKALGKRKAKYSWRDSAVEAGFLACGGGKIRAKIDCQENTYFVSGGKSSIEISGDVNTNKSIITYNTHLGRGVNILGKLHAKEACVIKNLSGRVYKEVRSSGEIKTRASWRDSKVVAGVLISGGGEINGAIHSQGNIYIIPGGKAKINIENGMLSRKNIIFYNTHLGRGVHFHCEGKDFYAGENFRLKNLNGNFTGILKACGEVEIKGDGIVKIKAGIYTPKDCTIMDTWGAKGEYLKGCIISKKLNISKIKKIIYHKTWTSLLLKK